MLSWASVQRILRAAPYLWIATTNPDGSPHLVQQWCVWVDDTLSSTWKPKPSRGRAT